MAVLIMNRFRKKDVDILKWLEDIDDDIYMVSTEEAANDYKELPVLIKLPKLLNNYNVEWEIEKLYNQKPFQTIIGLEETDIIRAGTIRERYGLVGQSEYSARAFRDKYLMKSIANQNGIPTPEFQQLESIYDLFDFIKKHNFPVIIKPVDGMSSRGITILKDNYSLENWLEKGQLEGFMVEKYDEESDIYHVDGIVINGEMFFCCSSKYIIPLINYDINNGSGSMLLSDSNPLKQRLQDFVFKILSVFPTPDITSFHAEIFHDKITESFKLCEIASRTIGGKAVELIENSYGLNIDRYITRAQCGKLDPQNINERILSACFFVPPSCGFLRRIPEAPNYEWCINFVNNGELNKLYNGPEKILDYYIFFLVEGETEEILEERISIIKKYIENNTVWSNEN